MDVEQTVFTRDIPSFTIIDESSRDSGFDSPSFTTKIMDGTPLGATPEPANTSGLNIHLSRRTLDFFALIDKENNPNGESDDLVFPLFMSPAKETKKSITSSDLSFDSPLSHKRCRKDDIFTSPLSKQRKSKFRKHISMPCSQTSPAPAAPDTSEIRIKDVLERMDEEIKLIGDGSTTHILPTVSGKNADLVSISHQTMGDVINGVYDESIGEYTVIDCRYPYEYDGGHIKGALNLYTEQYIYEYLKNNTSNVENKKHILIFHCEFSSERGPKLLRYLRSMDRKENAHRYPYLSFPEIYILEKGYKVFYENQKELCNPCSYTPMLHKDHSDDLRKFRIRSKSWTAGERRSKIRRSLMSPY